MAALRVWVVIPAFNEERDLTRVIAELCRELGERQQRDRFAFTLLVVDDGSTDGTWSALEGLCGTRPCGVEIRALSLIRNFGHQAALIAGLLEAAEHADAAMTMDADGEHPPAVIGELLDRWLAGHAVVHTARREHPNLGALKRASSRAYYWIMRRLAGIPIASGMADFKLWDGELLRQVRTFLPHCGSTRVFAAWLAPHAPVVRYDQNVVLGRCSRFSSRKMWSLALNGIVRYSDLPLRVTTLVGIAATLFGAALFCLVAWGTLVGRTVPGWASTVMSVAIMGGLQSFAIGVLGEYLLRNSFRRSLPPYVIARARRPAAAPPAQERAAGCAVSDIGGSAPDTPRQSPAEGGGAPLPRNPRGAP